MTCKNFANRAIAILLSIVMLIGMIPAVSAADTTITFSLECGTPESAAGAEYCTVPVTLNLTANPGLITLKGNLSYPEGFEITSVTGGLGKLANTSSTENYSANPYILAFADPDATADITATGTLAVVNFKVPVSALASANEVKFTPTDIMNFAREDLTANAGTATVSVSGDVSTSTAIILNAIDLPAPTLADMHNGKAGPGLTCTEPTPEDPVMEFSVTKDEFSGTYRKTIVNVNQQMNGNHIVKIYYKGHDATGAAYTFNNASSKHIPLYKTTFNDGTAFEVNTHPVAEQGADFDGWNYLIYDFSTSSVGSERIAASKLVKLDFAMFNSLSLGANAAFPRTFVLGRVAMFSSMDEARADTMEEKVPEGTECTVTYTSNGEVVYTQTVTAGAALAYPADLPALTAPVEGYEFNGWSVAEGTAVNSDIEVVAQWKAPTTVIVDLTTTKFSLVDQYNNAAPAGALEYIAPTAGNPVLTLRALDSTLVGGGEFRYSQLMVTKQDGNYYSMAGNHIIKLYYKAYDSSATPKTFTYNDKDHPTRKFYPIYKTIFSGDNAASMQNPAATGEDNGWQYIIIDYSTENGNGQTVPSKETIQGLKLKQLDLCPFGYTVPARAELTFPLNFEVGRLGLFSSMDAALADHMPVSEEPEVKEYTIKFVDEDGTVLDTQTVEEGETPVYAGKAPTKAATAQYTYTFAGWTPAVAAATADATYTATYTATVNKYTITWVVDGKETETTVAYGETPVFDGTPAKDADAQYTYTFAGWTPAVAAVTGDATYTAKFDKTVNKYTVTFVDEDGEVLDEQEVAYGETPVYAGETPVKEGDAQYSYKFVGWTPEVVAVDADATYTAKFEATVNAYTVTWVVEGETVDTDTVAYGETPEYTGETPVKEGDAQYSYEFAGWTPEVDVVTGDVTYTAKFTETVNKYTVTFVANGETVKTETVAYGEAATAPKAPAVEGYTFEGWDAEFDNITGDITVNAIYKEIVKYTVKVQSAGNGTVEIDGYGVEAVVVDDTDLTLIATCEEGYVFDGWYNVTNGSNELYSSDVIATFTVDSEDATFEARFRVEVIGAPVVDIVVPEVAGSTITKDEKDDGRVEISIELGGENIDNTVAFWYRETRTGGSMIYLGAGSSITVPPSGSEVDYVPYIVSQNTDEVVVYLGSANDIIEINPDVEPEGPAKYGMEFSGWDETTDGIVTIYKAKYAKLADKPYTLTIKYVDGGEESIEYQLYDTITATKTASENVEWVLVDIDGNETVISNKADCRFAIMSTDYVTLEERVLDGEAKALVTSQGVVYDRGVAKIRFSASYDLPEGATLLGVGVILANADSVTAKPENINHNTNGVIVGAIENPRYTNFIITKGKVEAGDTWYGRPYVTYQIGDKVETIYGTTMICTAN